MVILVMGVCGCGKSTLGAALAERLGAAFIEGDAFHPPANIAKMRAGTALSDEDRWPWLDALAAEVRARVQRGENAVLACSALRAAYRARLLEGAPPPGAWVVHLSAPRAALRQAIESRAGQHFMPASLLDSQLATLESPSGLEPDVVGVLTLCAFTPMGPAVEQVVAWINGFRAGLR